MMNARATLLLGLLVLVVGCDRPAADPAQRTRTGSSVAAAPSTNHSEATVTKTEEEWRKTLTPEQYAVLRQKGTERAFTGKYDEFFQPGTYVCAACGQELFSSDTKFNSGCGWPAFYAAKAGDRVKLTTDDSYGMHRVEVTCARCGSHLGHVFDDAPDQPTGQRYCINSVSLKFIPADPKAKMDTPAKPNRP
jgi:peptide-methionine (R)-S-oxide reductase